MEEHEPSTHTHTHTWGRLIRVRCSDARQHIAIRILFLDAERTEYIEACVCVYYIINNWTNMQINSKQKCRRRNTNNNNKIIIHICAVLPRIRIITLLPTLERHSQHITFQCELHTRKWDHRAMRNAAYMYMNLIIISLFLSRTWSDCTHGLMHAITIWE